MSSSKPSRATDESRARRISKKDQIISLYTSGIGEVEDLAMITGARPSYVASVLQEFGLMTGYFDLYTTSAHPMNVYSKFFAGRLGFKDEAAARASIEVIDRLYRQFELARDRAGQHHGGPRAVDHDCGRRTADDDGPHSGHGGFGAGRRRRPRWNEPDGEQHRPGHGQYRRHQ